MDSEQETTWQEKAKKQERQQQWMDAAFRHAKKEVEAGEMTAAAGEMTAAEAFDWCERCWKWDREH